MKIHDTRLQRAIRDHGDWLTELDGRVHQNLIQIDAGFEAKGTFRSGMRLQARADAKSGALFELKKARDRLSDLRTDITHEETFLERAYRRLRHRPLAPIAIPVSDQEAEIEQRWSAPEGGQDGMPMVHPH